MFSYRVEAADKADPILARAAGIDLIHVPFKGDTEGATALAGGHIDIHVAVPVAYKSLVDGKKVRVLAVAAETRSPLYGNAPTFRENGADLTIGAFHGVFAPKGTPAAIVQKLNEAASATIDTPAVRERLREIGVSTVARERRSPDYLQKFVEGEIEKWAAPIRSAGVTAE